MSKIRGGLSGVGSGVRFRSEIRSELEYTFQVMNIQSELTYTFQSCMECSSVLIEVYVCMSEIRAELASRSETYISGTGVVSGSSLR